jgi:hypothetical protein
MAAGLVYAGVACLTSWNQSSWGEHCIFQVFPTRRGPRLTEPYPPPEPPLVAWRVTPTNVISTLWAREHSRSRSGSDDPQYLLSLGAFQLVYGQVPRLSTVPVPAQVPAW